MDFFKKYLKYKDKYITLKNQSGGGLGGPPGPPPGPTSTRIVIMNDANQFLTCQNGRNYYNTLTGGNSIGLVRGKTVQQLINFLIANGLTNPDCNLNAMFNAEINAGMTISNAAQQHATAPIALAPVQVVGGAGPCVPAPITTSGRTCADPLCIHDGIVENWFRQKLLPYLDQRFKYMIINDYQLKIFSTAPNSGIILIGGQKEGTLTLVQNIIKETCEELFYHIPVAQQNIDTANPNGEPRQLAGGVVNNTLYTLGTVGEERIYFYKVSNADGIAIRDYAIPNLDKSEIINLGFRNRADITSQPIRNLLATFGLG